ncbi:hypothetical protein D6D22_08835 [Aureobasidium pullulans]|uniref:Uncharacterized protein n=1 Tax=Aureobasidium pullulans TaxID=5580 RepID=A0A4S8XA36_AURPU|nr:hypothetical protein D6D22_08835 [Aureobasidium pullulans]
MHYARSPEGETELVTSAMTIGLPLLTSLTQTFDLRQSRRCEMARYVRRTGMSLLGSKRCQIKCCGWQA